MAFRAGEAGFEGLRRAKEVLVAPSNIHDPEERNRCSEELEKIVKTWGPVVRSYPVWHPLINRANDGKISRYPIITKPNVDTGFRGLDHTILLANGFLTCPYSDGLEVVECVMELDRLNVETARREGLHKLPARLRAEILDVKLYSPRTTTVLVTCEWEMNDDGTIPLKYALPLLLEKELPNRAHTQVSETWEKMRGYLLGEPCGSVSSLHINSKTGRALKKAYEMLQDSGMFGPVYY